MTNRKRCDVDHSVEDLVQVCRRLYEAIDKLDTRADSLENYSRNELQSLNLLAEAPSKPSRIAKELGLTSGSVTSLLDRLERANLIRRARVQVARRLIGQKDLWAVGQGPANRDPLLFPARHLRGSAAAAAGEAGVNLMLARYYLEKYLVDNRAEDAARSNQEIEIARAGLTMIFA